MRARVEALNEKLAEAWEHDLSAVEWALFETYRTPERQTYVKSQGASKAVAWASLHQWGMAADYAVKLEGGGFGWDARDVDWKNLHNIAATVGLTAPILWDKGHLIPVEISQWLYHLKKGAR